MGITPQKASYKSNRLMIYDVIQVTHQHYQAGQQAAELATGCTSLQLRAATTKMKRSATAATCATARQPDSVKRNVLPALVSR